LQNGGRFLLSVLSIHVIFTMGALAPAGMGAWAPKHP